MIDVDAKEREAEEIRLLLILEQIDRNDNYVQAKTIERERRGKLGTLGEVCLCITCQRLDVLEALDRVRKEGPDPWPQRTRPSW